jgi:electron transfer flavoprotein beta subunit
MKVLVPVKHVIDHNVRVRVKTDHSGVETERVKMSINPFDEIALEAALQLKEAGQASEVLIVSIGAANVQDSLRHGLALGADRALWIDAASTGLEPIHIAKVLRQLANNESAQLVLMGKQAIDDDCNQTAQMLSALLDWPQALFASKIEWQDSGLQVTREVDGGLQTDFLPLPAVVSADLRLNTPRYATLPNIMKAKQKKIERQALTDLLPVVTAHTEVLHVTAPPQRQAGVKVKDLSELMDKLRNEAKVLP